jgi:AcrR family transcriptional regulator
MPRSYRLGQRQAATDQTRARILVAARDLLMSPAGYARLSVEAVARQADVARMTVYHQFGSKIGLLEGICDTLAVNGGMDELATAFRRPDPLDTLDEYLRIFGRFWEADRLVMRRLRALAALDPDFEHVIRARDGWRRQGLSVITQRLVEQQVLAPEAAHDDILDVLFTLSSFETFDTLAGPTRSLEEVAPLVARLAHAALLVTKRDE